MEVVSGIEILFGHAEGQVELTFAQIVFLRMILYPGQLNLKIGRLVGQIDDDEGAVRRLFPAALLHAQRLFAEGE